MLLPAAAAVVAAARAFPSALRRDPRRTREALREVVFLPDPRLLVDAATSRALVPDLTTPWRPLPFPEVDCFGGISGASRGATTNESSEWRWLVKVSQMDEVEVAMGGWNGSDGKMRHVR